MILYVLAFLQSSKKKILSAERATVFVYVSIETAHSITGSYGQIKVYKEKQPQGLNAVCAYTNLLPVVDIEKDKNR